MALRPRRCWSIPDPHRRVAPGEIARVNLIGRLLSESPMDRAGHVSRGHTGTPNVCGSFHERRRGPDRQLEPACPFGLWSQSCRHPESGRLRRPGLAPRQPLRRQPPLHARQARDLCRFQGDDVAPLGTAGAVRSPAPQAARRPRPRHRHRHRPLSLLGTPRQRVRPIIPQRRVHPRSRVGLLEAAGPGR